MNLDDLLLDSEQSIEIGAPAEKVFAALLDRFGRRNTRPDGEPMPMVLEARAGGRWYRDRGEGVEHLWGFVQVIKPPSLLEISGPMFMSYPANNHVELKVEEADGGSRVTIRHRAIGMIDPDHRKGLTVGWNAKLAQLKQDCE